MLSQGTTAWCGALVQTACTWSTGSAVNRKNTKTIVNMGKLSKNHFSSVSVKEDWSMLPHGITGPPDQSSRNSGNKLWLTTPLTRPNFVVFPQKVCIQNYVGAYVHFCNDAKSCAYWLVNETLWYETETFDFQSETRSRPRPSHVSTRPRRLETTSRDRDVETETTSLPPAHINMPPRKITKDWLTELTF